MSANMLVSATQLLHRIHVRTMARAAVKESSANPFAIGLLGYQAALAPDVAQVAETQLAIVAISDAT